MNILITGGTGLIGKALITAFADHPITVLTRSIAKAKTQLPNNLTFIESLDELENFDAFDAVVNLAGEPIIDKRWNPQQKEVICQSRWQITEQLVEKIAASSKPPKVFISGSAVGIYGDQGAQEIDENSPFTSGSFAHRVCDNWEKIALKAQSDQTRVCLVRTGIVLSDKGGAIKKMLPSFQLGLGGSIGSGKQYYPWVHIDDEVQAIIHLLTTDSAQGAFNLTAPNPVTNKAFGQSLAKALHRPSFFNVPACVISLTIGEGAHLLLDSQRVVPSALIKSGYQFRFSDIDAAFAHLFS